MLFEQLYPDAYRRLRELYHDELYSNDGIQRPVDLYSEDELDDEEQDDVGGQGYGDERYAPSGGWDI